MPVSVAAGVGRSIGVSYAVISPVRDEARHLRRLADSLARQQLRPERWVIVDDGSTDGTGEIAATLAERHDWIEAVDSGAEHGRARGAPIVQAFNKGLERLQRLPEFVVKLDGDLHLPAHYFAWVAETFRRDPSAGIVGGTVLVHDGSRWRPDTVSAHNVHGVAKAYRTQCLRDIGGLPASMGWDGIDEYAARARGWHARVLSELTILHYDKRGAKQRWWTARFEEGLGAHHMGYRPDFLALRVVYRMVVEHPPLLGGLALGAGYLWARLRRVPQTADPAARAALQDEQRTRLRLLLRGRRYRPPDAPTDGPAFWAGPS
jgi:biofilm PGA synthesis N-glycosyltransferase PgaC